MKLYDYVEINNLADEWIECIDGLPPPGQEVIVETKKGIVTALSRFLRYDGCDHSESWWDNNYPCSGNTHLFKSVVRWKPMPRNKED